MSVSILIRYRHIMLVFSCLLRKLLQSEIYSYTSFVSKPLKLIICQITIADTYDNTCKITDKLLLMFSHNYLEYPTATSLHSIAFLVQ